MLSQICEISNDYYFRRVIDTSIVEKFEKFEKIIFDSLYDYRPNHYLTIYVNGQFTNGKIFPKVYYIDLDDSKKVMEFHVLYYNGEQYVYDSVNNINIKPLFSLSEKLLNSSGKKYKQKLRRKRKRKRSLPINFSYYKVIDSNSERFLYNSIFPISKIDVFFYKKLKKWIFKQEEVFCEQKICPKSFKVLKKEFRPNYFKTNHTVLDFDRYYRKRMKELEDKKIKFLKKEEKHPTPENKKYMK